MFAFPEAGTLTFVTGNALAAFYRRYNACGNEHGFDDLGEFVAPTS